MHRKIALIGIACCAFALFIGNAEAFLDTEGLSQALESIDQETENGDNLANLLDELDQVTTESPETHLTVYNNGKATIMRDVPKSAWFFPHVQALTQLGIVAGYKDAQGHLTGEYGPANNVTQAEALKIAIGAAGIDPSTCSGSPAHPQAQSHWAKQYVVCAEQRDFGLTNSQGLNTAATRAEVLHYLLQAFGVEVPEGNPPFADSKSHRYKNDIAFAYALEIISGDTNANGSEKGTFRPDDPINRAEVAKIVKLAIELL